VASKMLARKVARMIGQHRLIDQALLVSAFKVEACSSGAYLARVARPFNYVQLRVCTISADHDEFQNYRSN